MTVEYVQGSKDITETERDSIENSIGTIASTPYGSAPFIRSMGIKHPPSSKSELERNQYATEVIAQCAIWEDRARLRQIVFDQNDTTKAVVEYGKR